MKSEKLIKSEKLRAIAGEILNLSRHTILLHLRFLNAAVNKLVLTDDSLVAAVTGGISGIGTDGIRLYYDPEYIVRGYREDKAFAARMYLHCVLHAIFQHFYVGAKVSQRLWDVACDLSVEAVICELKIPGTEVADEARLRDEIRGLQEKVKNLTAERILRYLKEDAAEEEIERLENLFCRDDHHFWYLMDDEEQNQADSGDQREKDVESKELDSDNQKHQSRDPGEEDSGRKRQQKEEERQRRDGALDGWRKISLQVQMELESFLKDRGDQAGTMMQNLRAVNREHYDYRKFLEKFAARSEALQMNDEEFDYIFYTYGLNLYGNVPLVEPLEYKEVKRIRDFVVVIDTSGSTRGELVQTFVQKTYNILRAQDSYHEKMNLHIIQCDAAVQEDVKITSEAEMSDYLSHMVIKGQGGTDFRPAFRYVEELKKKGEFQDLRGLIYFTDGFGIFPEKQPDYKTAVVYIEEDYENPEVPVWAIRLMLRPEEIRPEEI